MEVGRDTHKGVGADEKLCGKAAGGETPRGWRGQTVFRLHSRHSLSHHAAEVLVAELVDEALELGRRHPVLKGHIGHTIGLQALVSTQPVCEKRKGKSTQ